MIEIKKIKSRFRVADLLTKVKNILYYHMMYIKNILKSGISLIRLVTKAETALH